MTYLAMLLIKFIYKILIISQLAGFLPAMINILLFLPKIYLIYKMDYFSLLPTDLLRQTALYSSSEEVFKLSLDPTFNKIFTDKFWTERLEMDKEYFAKYLPSLNILQIKEKPYNEWLYLYYRCLEKDLDSSSYKVDNLLTWNIIYSGRKVNLHEKPINFNYFPSALKLEIAVRNKLTEERGKDWPQVYFVNSMDKIKDPKIYDMFVNKNDEKYVIFGNWFEFISGSDNFILFQPLFDKLNYISKIYSNRELAIKQIYLIKRI